MSESTTFQQVAEDLLGDLGETITYNGASILAGVSYEEDLEQKDKAAKAKCVIVVKTADVAAPTYRDTVVIGSTTWKVLNIAKGDGYTWTLKLYRDERPVL
jgi:hypothetical protein